jgi:hypothetical protein
LAECRGHDPEPFRLRPGGRRARAQQFQAFEDVGEVRDRPDGGEAVEEVGDLLSEAVGAIVSLKGLAGRGPAQAGRAVAFGEGRMEGCMAGQ